MCQADVCFVRTNAANAHGCRIREDVLTNQFWKTGELWKASNGTNRSVSFHRGGRDWKEGMWGMQVLVSPRRSPSMLEVGERYRQFAQTTASSMKQPRRHRACNVQSDDCIASLNFRDSLLLWCLSCVDKWWSRFLCSYGIRLSRGHPFNEDLRSVFWCVRKDVYRRHWYEIQYQNFGG